MKKWCPLCKKGILQFKTIQATNGELKYGICPKCLFTETITTYKYETKFRRRTKKERGVS